MSSASRSVTSRLFAFALSKHLTMVIEPPADGSGRKTGWQALNNAGPQCSSAPVAAPALSSWPGKLGRIPSDALRSRKQ